MKAHKQNQAPGSGEPCEFEQRVCRQLVEALLFEQIVSYQLEQDVFTFVMNTTAYQAQGRIGSFGRIRLIDGSLYCYPTTKKTFVTLAQLLEDLPTNTAVKAKLGTELSQTVKLCQWNQQYLDKPFSRRRMSYLELESALDEGHPYHPCFKARTGFSIDDHKHYGPECGNTFQLNWLAIEQQLLSQSLPCADRDFWLTELGESGLATLEERLSAALEHSGQQTEDFHLMPIHPWQWQSIGQELLGELLRQQKVLHLGAAGDLYQASISVRTLVNVSHPEKANIKLPMNMVNTSSLRTIEEHSVCTAPAISAWLRQLSETDDFLLDGKRLGLLDEYAGIVLDHRKAQHYVTDPQWSQKIEGQLSVIFRRSLSPETAGGLSALPFPAVFSKERDGHAFIHPWLTRYGLLTWLSRLIDVVVIPVWHLLVHHGVALEAHAQNMVLLHKDGWPEKVLLRDFHESLEFHWDYLACPELAPDFASLHPAYTSTSGKAAPDNQFFWMDSLEALRELLVDTLFVFNLSELSYLLSNEYGFCEDRFWKITAERLAHYAASACTDEARIVAIPLSDALIQTESLMKRKLEGSSSNEYHHMIPNPLHCGASHAPEAKDATRASQKKTASAEDCLIA